MFFSATEEDEADFNPREGSKLASLFGMDKAASSGGNESLKYQAPKEPKKDPPASQSGSDQPSVLHAVATFAYKFVDGKAASQGKLGTAIIGSHVTREYRLLLYVSKQQQVTHASINADFSFSVQPSNYVTFHDSARQSWSLMFDSEAQLTQFAKQVALAKANTAGPSLSTPITQDLTPGEGGGLDTGDSLEMKLIGCLLTNHSIGAEFENHTDASKLLRLKVGKGKLVKGLEEGVLGLKKGQSRLIVVPPSLGYGTQGRGDSVPGQSTLVYEVTAVRVKLAKDKSGTDESSTSEAPTPTPGPRAPSEPPQGQPSPAPTPGGPPEGEGADKQAGTEQAPKSNKAKLISRIAKMGQPMFPTATDTSPSDLDTDTQVQSPSPEVTSPKPALPSKPVLPPSGAARHVSPVSLAQPTAVHPATMVQPGMVQGGYQQGFTVPGSAANQISLYQTPMQMMHPQFGAPQPLYPAPPYIPPGPPLPSDAGLQETRQHNTEVRVSLSKMADKVDRISERLDALYHQQSHPSGVMATLGMAPSMDTAVLLSNIQRIVQENDKLKQENVDKITKIESQNEKISDLLNRNQKFLEQSNTMLEQRSDAFKTSTENSQAKLLALEQDKILLQTQVTSLTSRLSAADTEYSATSRQTAELRARLETAERDSGTHRRNLEAAEREQETHRQRAGRMQGDVKDAQREAEDLSNQLREEKQQRKKLEKELNNLKEEMADGKSSKSQTDPDKKWTDDKVLLTQELEDTKKYYEGELAKLKEKLKEAKGDASIFKSDNDVAREWRDKCDRVAREGEARLQEVTNQARVERDIMEQRLKDAQVKFEALRDKSAEMKMNYEAKIVGQEGRSAGDSKQEVVSEVKRIMSSVYHSLKSEFEEKTTYDGAAINSTIMDTVKSVTLQLIQSQEEESAKKQGPTAEVSEIFVKEASPVTGDRGNPYYAAELEKRQKDAKAQEIVSEVISAAVAPSTGGKGNPYYAAELNKAAEVSAASEQKSKESEKEKQKPEGKPKEKPQSKPAEARKPTEKPKPSNEGKPQEKPKPKPNEQPKSDKKPVDKVTKPAPESKKPEKDTKSSTEAKSDTKSVETKPDKDSKVQKDSGKTSEATSESVKKTDQKKSEPQKTESAKSEGKPTESAKPQSTSSTDKPKIPVRTLTDSDDDLRPKPPPLFDDDDESEDDDWLTPKIRK